MTSILQATAVAVLTLGAGTTAVTVMRPDVPDFAVPEGPWVPGAALDGRVFRVLGTIAETGGEMPEGTFSFEDGRFQSSRCQVYCAFGWQDYRTWQDGNAIRFTATTRCPSAPHTVVWYGIVEGDEMRFEGTWTTRRWYWTRQITVTGRGEPTSSATAAGGL